MEDNKILKIEGIMDVTHTNIFTNFKKWQPLDRSSKKKIFKGTLHKQRLIKSKVRKNRYILPYMLVILWLLPS